MKYHKSLGFPNTIIFPKGYVKLKYSKHAMEKREYVKKKEWPSGIVIKKEDIIEIKSKDNIACEKVIIRFPYHKNEVKEKIKEVVLVLKINKKFALVLTCWLNNIEDNHDTLDKSKYNVPK